MKLNPLFKSLAKASSCLALTSLLLVGASDSVHAASATWQGNSSDANWATNANWIGGVTSGSNTTTGNTDIATFVGAGTAGTNITVDSGRNLKSIVFDTGASSYTFGGGAFKLTNTGTIALNATTVGAVETFNTPIVFQGSGYAFANNSLDSSSYLVFAGDISSPNFNSTTLTVGGSGVSTGNLISGNMSDGAASNVLKLTMGHTAGKWTISGSNSYTGLTTISGANGTTEFKGKYNSNSTGGITLSASAATVMQLNSSTNGGLPYGTFTFTKGTVEVLGATRTISNPVTFNPTGSSDTSIIGSQSLVLTGTSTVSTSNNQLNNNLSGGATLTFGDVVVNSGITFKVAGTGTTVVNGAISSSGGLTVNSGATLTLNGTNTYSGASTFSSGGFVNIGSSRALSTGTVTIAGTIDNTSGGALTNQNVTPFSLSSAGITFIGSNDLNLGTGSVSTLNGSIFNLNGANKALTFGGTFSNIATANKTVTINGPGTLVLAGTVVPMATNSSKSQGLIFSGNANLNISGNIVESATTSQMTYNTTGIVNLSGNNSYDGTTLVQSGLVLLNSATAIPGGIAGTPTAGSLQVRDGGILGLTDASGDLTRVSGTAAGQFNVAPSTGDVGFAAFGGDRIVNMGGAAATLTWAATGFFNNNTTGGLVFGYASSGTTSNGMVDFQNPINLQSSNAIVNRTINVADGSAAVDAKISGALTRSSGTAGIIKTGSGALELSAINTYNGSTAVNMGTLIVSGSLTGSTALSVLSGAQLKVNGFVNAASTTTVNSGGTLAGSGTIGKLSLNGAVAPGNSGLGTLTSGSTSLGVGGSYVLELNNTTGAAGTNWDQLNASTLDLSSLSAGNTFTLKLSAGALSGWDDSSNYTWAGVFKYTTLTGLTNLASQFSIDTTGFANAFTGSFSLVNNSSTNSLDLQYIAVPEPSTYAMLVGGIGMLCWGQRLRRKSR